MPATSLFLIELEHGKYFAGASPDPIKALEAYREGLGEIPSWLSIHRPLRLREVVAVAQSEELDAHVQEWMARYGVENVRGGSWTDVRLRDTDRQRIREGVVQKRGCIVF